MQNRLGIDVGGVIIDRKKNDSSDTSLFGPQYLRAHAVEGAFQSIRQLHSHFDGQVYIVSKCGHNIERKTREWMEANSFHEETGVPRENLRFCRSRADKAPICKDLGITHFIDDKLEVLSYLETVPTKYLFDPSLNEIANWQEHLPKVRVVNSWDEIVAILLAPPVGGLPLFWVKLKYSSEAKIGDFEGRDGVRFSLEHYPTCYRRGPWKLLIEVSDGKAPHKWGCFDDQDQPVRFYHSEERAKLEAEAIAKVLSEERRARE